jgi:hypothetical protein
VQAGGDVNVHGPSYSDVRQIALDVLRANFIEVQGLARKTVDARFNELVDGFLEKLSTSGVDLSVMQDPDMQYSFAVAGREYARSGDGSQKQILLDLLLKKSGTDARSLESIIYSEAISTVGRLTSLQITALAAYFSLHNLMEGSIKTHDRLVEMLKFGTLPFKEGLLINRLDVRHLAYAGCIENSYIIPCFGFLFQSKFPSLFQAGIDESEMPEDWNDFKDDVFVRSPMGDGRFWLKADSAEAAKELAVNVGRPDLADRFSWFVRFDKWKANEKAADSIIVKLVPEFSEIVESWETNAFSSMEATTVGSAIGHVFWAQKLGVEL